MKYGIGFCIEKRKGNKSLDSPISMNVSVGGKYFRYYTGCRCAVDQWIDKTSDGEHIQQVKRNVTTPRGESFTNINQKLNNLRSEVKSFIDRCEALKVEPNFQTLKIELDNYLNKRAASIEPEGTGFFDRYEQYAKESNVSFGRKNHLQSSINKLKAFRPDTSFKKLDVQYLIDYNNYLLADCGLSKNTAIGEMKLLRAFIRYAHIKRQWIANYPFESFSLDSEAYGEPVFITIEERDLLYNAGLSSPHLQRVRDIFVFQCLIGCRVGDLVKLKRSNIIDGCIEYIAGKTKENEPRVARVPLTEKARSILSKYDLPDGKLLPFITDQRYNEYIKIVFEEAKITRMVTIKDPKTRTGKQVRICDIATSHMARRVFVGSLYQKGIKNEIIASMSGHTQDSKSFNRYYKIDRESQKDAIKMIE